MLEIAILFFIGLGATFLVKGAFMFFFLKNWLQHECKSQGPDYIRRRLIGHVVLWVAIAVGVIVVLLVVDRFFFSHRGTVMHIVRKLPGLGEWGDYDVIALPDRK